MNSEITNVAKLVPVTALRNKQTEPKAAESDSSAVKTQVNGLIAEDAKAQTAALTTDEASRTETKPPLEEVKSATKEANSMLQAVNRNLEFKVDDSTSKVVVKIVDSKSGEVVRQIPSEEVLAFIKRMQELEGNQGSVYQDRA
ncbi:MAG: flagellar biosynthesis protein FlaG [Methylomonas sp.]|jgi:flagellar protein FlaG|nr:MAG: flagellar biosynthesis protein FlaG [Methylomonas sp.]